MISGHGAAGAGLTNSPHHTREARNNSDYLRPTLGANNKKVSPYEDAKARVMEKKEADWSRTPAAFDQIEEQARASGQAFNGWVTQKQVEDILRILLGKDVAEYGVACVMNDARDDATLSGVELGEDKTVPRESVIRAVNKYRHYLEGAGRLEVYYNRFDVSKAGYVEQRRLKAILDATKNKDPELAFGKISELHATIYNYETFKENLSFVFANSCINDDGSVWKAEMLPALATWEMLAIEYLKARGANSCCALM